MTTKHVASGMSRWQNIRFCNIMMIGLTYVLCIYGEANGTTVHPCDSHVPHFSSVTWPLCLLLLCSLSSAFYLPFHLWIHLDIYLANLHPSVNLSILSLSPPLSTRSAMPPSCVRRRSSALVSSPPFTFSFFFCVTSRSDYFSFLILTRVVNASLFVETNLWLLI